MFHEHHNHHHAGQYPGDRAPRGVPGRRGFGRHFARHVARHFAHHASQGNGPFGGPFEGAFGGPFGGPFAAGPRQGGPFDGFPGGPFGGGPFGGGPFGGRGGRGPGRGGLGRFFAHGDLRLVLLSLIAEKPRHGYELIKAVEERVAGAYAPSPGVVYPTLTLLEELGYIAVQPSEGKKRYEITPEGRAFLEANRAAVDALFARMNAAATEQGGPPAPQILRAMENLRVALRLRMARGALDEAQTQAVAAALDAAALAVERA